MTLTNFAEMAPKVGERPMEIQMQLAEKVDELKAMGSYALAWNNYRDTLFQLIIETKAKSVLEVGGGRFPYLTREEIERLGIEYTANDISARELSLAPKWVHRAHFDVQTSDRERILLHANSFDFVFSKMVMEHVENFERAYRNIYDILKPGGVSLAFHPVLYAAPFVINRLIPERLSARLLKALFPHRTDDGVPKFPATYSGCQISERVQKKIAAIGFRQVWQIPFYGHNYYRKLPVVRTIHASATKWICGQGITPLASYAYTIVVK